MVADRARRIGEHCCRAGSSQPRGQAIPGCSTAKVINRGASFCDEHENNQRKGEPADELSEPLPRECAA